MSSRRTSGRTGCSEQWKRPTFRCKKKNASTQGDDETRLVVLERQEHLGLGATTSNQDDARLWQVRLAHLSVKEYLLSTSVLESFKNDMTALNAKVAIVQICLTYLSDIDGLDDEEAVSVRKFQRLFPFSMHAARSWPENAATAQIYEDALTQIVQFLEHKHENRSGFTSSVYLNPPRLEYRLTPCSARLPKVRLLPLYYASAFSLTQVVLRLIQRGADVNEGASDCSLNSILTAAVRTGLIDLVQMLLDHGAILTEESLVCAAMEGHCHIVQLIPAHGNSTNAVLGKEERSSFSRRTGFADYTKTSAIRYATDRGHTEVVRILLEHGVNANYQRFPSHHGPVMDGPLHIAVKKAHKSVMQLLVGNNANPNAVDEYGRTPLHYASKLDQLDTAQCLLLNNADVDAVDQFGYTPLNFARITNMVSLLLKHGANVYAKEKEGRTVIHWASEDDEDTRLLLLSAMWKQRRVRNKHTQKIRGIGSRGPIKAQETTRKSGRRWYVPRSY